MSILIEKLFVVHDSLTEAAIPHAFGGAIALAYATNDPRATSDIDVNIFVPASEAERVFEKLPAEIEVKPLDLEKTNREGQIRLRWGETPVDLFLNNLPFHDEVAKGTIWVPLEGREIPVLDAGSLVIFKAMFDRTKDWADIEAVIDWNAEEVSRALDTLAELIGRADPICQRLESLLNQQP